MRPALLFSIFSFFLLFIAFAAYAQTEEKIPPTFSNFEVTPASINAGETVSFRVQIEDDLEVDEKSLALTITSPLGKKFQSTTPVRVLGNTRNGFYQARWTAPADTFGGTYTVIGFVCDTEQICNLEKVQLGSFSVVQTAPITETIQIPEEYFYIAGISIAVFLLFIFRSRLPKIQIRRPQFSLPQFSIPRLRLQLRSPKKTKMETVVSKLKQMQTVQKAEQPRPMEKMPVKKMKKKKKQAGEDERHKRNVEELAEIIKGR